jgi:uncharacterized protein (TIGR04255 family)
MAQPRNLKNPPIVEAILDLSVRFATPPKPETLGDLAKDLGADYQAAELRHMFQIVVGVQTPTGSHTAAPPVVNSYIFRTKDLGSAVQSRPEGFTFSTLPPYEDWADLIAKALPIWEKYRARFRPTRIVRCSVRYLNRLMLPGPKIDFDDYIVGLPRIPPELPQELTEFNSSYVVPLTPTGTIGRVGLSFSSNNMTDISVVPVLFDIDILQECDVDPMDLQSVHAILSNLRLLKNHVFFGTLTDKAIRVFE